MAVSLVSVMIILADLLPSCKLSHQELDHYHLQSQESATIKFQTKCFITSRALSVALLIGLDWKPLPALFKRLLAARSANGKFNEYKLKLSYNVWPESNQTTIRFSRIFPHQTIHRIESLFPYCLALMFNIFIATDLVWTTKTNPKSGNLYLLIAQSNEQRG